MTIDEITGDESQTFVKTSQIPWQRIVMPQRRGELPSVKDFMEWDDDKDPVQPQARTKSLLEHFIS